MAVAAETNTGTPDTRDDGEAEARGFWAAPGNAFGLGAMPADGDLHGLHIESTSNSIPSLCVECMAPTMDDGTGSIRCDACDSQARRIGRTRGSMAVQTCSMVTNGAVAMAAIHMAIQAARTSRAHAHATAFSNEYVSFALAAALLAVTISGARGEAFGNETFGRNPQVNL